MSITLQNNTIPSWTRTKNSISENPINIHKHEIQTPKPSNKSQHPLPFNFHTAPQPNPTLRVPHQSSAAPRSSYENSESLARHGKLRKLFLLLTGASSSLSVLVNEIFMTEYHHRRRRRVGTFCEEDARAGHATQPTILGDKESPRARTQDSRRVATRVCVRVWVLNREAIREF